MSASERIRGLMPPQRIILAIMGFLSIVISLSIRACLSVAITEMVVSLNDTKVESNSLICPNNPNSNDSVDTIQIAGTKYNWSQEQQGYILSGFYVGYLISHIPGGLLTQKFGGKWILSLGILTIILCNFLTPLTMQYGEANSLIWLVLLRIVMGLGSGPIFPALTVLLAVWVPPKEKATLTTIAFSGGPVGILLSFFLTGVILSNWSWLVVFYFWSSVASIWLIAFTSLCYNDPASHPFITKEEMQHLEVEIGQLKRNTNLGSTLWLSILTSVPVLVFIIAQFGGDWFVYIMITDLPKYMKEILGFSVRDIGLYSSLPFLFQWIVSISSGFICDHLIASKYVSVVRARKIFTIISGILPITFVISASYAGCHRLLFVIYLTLALSFDGCSFPGYRVNVLDFSPNYAGSIMAISNGLGSLAGIVAPIFVGLMTPDSTLEQWRFVFWITFGIGIVRTAIYLIGASADIQPWNDSRQHNKITE